MNPSAASVAERLASAADACRRQLQEDHFAETLAQIGAQATPDWAFRLLSGVYYDDASCSEIARLSVPCTPGLQDQNFLERSLLLLASQHAIARLAECPVSDTVKGLFADEFHFFAAPPQTWVARFQASNVRFREMARLATLRRFPAGQFHWELSAFPRSWALKARSPWRVIPYVFGTMRGFSPMFELHVNDRRKNRILLLEREANLSYYRVARSIELQPEVLGITLGSWLFCKSTAQISPHLAWLRQIPEAAGAMLVELGPAQPDSGFLTGSQERRKLYEQGSFQPTHTCVLWSRNDLIAWANRHPEFAAN